MIAEIVAALAWLIAGSALVWACGIRGPAVPAVGFLSGVAVHVGWTGALTAVGLPAPAPTAIAATLLTGAAVLVWSARVHDLPWPRFGPALAAAGGAAALAATSWRSGFVQVTPDTFRYLTVTGLLRSGQAEEASAFLLETRLLAVPAMHTPASAEALYLRSVTPLLALACLVTLGWLVRRGLGRGVAWPAATTVVTLAVLLLATNNRFVWHAFYVNGHLALAAWLLLLGGTAWLIIGRRVPPGTWFAPLHVAVLPAIVLTRPEAPLLAALVLAPLWVDRNIAARYRYPSALVLGAATAAWHAYVWGAYGAQGDDASASALAMLIVGLGLVVVAGVIARVDHFLPRRSLGLAEAGLWALLVVLATSQPGVLYRSATATLSNLTVRGGWGTSLLVVAAIAVLVLLTGERSAARTSLRFPLTTFVPFGLLLAYLREAPYRVGPGDSLNRMLLHVLPLAVLLIATAIDDHCGQPSEDGTVRSS